MKPTNDTSAQALLPLHITTTPPPSSMSAGQFLANKDRLCRWCLAALVVSGMVNVLALAILAQVAGQPPWFLTLDAAGNPHSGPGTRFADARKLHVQQSVDAATALLYRSQNDFDFPERLQDLFSLPALDAANKLKNDEAQEFRDKAISQKALIARVEALDTLPDLVRVAVSGKLVRTGVFHQQMFTEVIPFNLTLTFQFNPDLLRTGRFPTIVKYFLISYANAE